MQADVATALCRRAGGNAPSASTQRGGYKECDRGQSPLPRDRGKNEKDAADSAKKQTHDPELASLCERRNRRDGDRDLEHGHAACEHFVLVKVRFRDGFLALGF